MSSLERLPCVFLKTSLRSDVLSNPTYCLTLLAILVVVAISRQLHAQVAGLKLEHLSLEQGLSQSTVNAIVQNGYARPIGTEHANNITRVFRAMISAARYLRYNPPVIDGAVYNFAASDPIITAEMKSAMVSSPIEQKLPNVLTSLTYALLQHAKAPSTDSTRLPVERPSPKLQRGPSIVIPVPRAEQPASRSDSTIEDRMFQNMQERIRNMTETDRLQKEYEVSGAPEVKQALDESIQRGRELEQERLRLSTEYRDSPSHREHVAWSRQECAVEDTLAWGSFLVGILAIIALAVFVFRRVKSGKLRRGPAIATYVIGALSTPVIHFCTIVAANAIGKRFGFFHLLYGEDGLVAVGLVALNLGFALVAIVVFLIILTGVRAKSNV